MSYTGGYQGGDISKPTSRVLQPPGGATSNIFGGDESSVRKPIKPVNNSHSNIFGTEENSEPASRARSLDDNENLATNNQLQDGNEMNIKAPEKTSPWKEDNRTPFEAAVDNRRRMRESSNPILGGSEQANEGKFGKQQRGGYNPITGETYNDGEKEEPVQRRRQPPGGHSTGLW
ncbi:DgyrCDS3652 [Dimorphilus gyrociliatus]|uniref:Microtubule-associated protein Jupiter n=1 Tax=Dimorphilus gyrociliatus TaxID=2664684 RepID=A0A7I8VFR9_9ANNE|nr:DgyrCDS3652 [Dimorphilus gyrociliatus]